MTGGEEVSSKEVAAQVQGWAGGGLARPVRHLVAGCATSAPVTRCSSPATTARPTRPPFPHPPASPPGILPASLAPQIRRVLPYLKSSRGGLTCSGGEPLLQPEFCAALFQEARAMGLTTTLDTTGQGTKRRNWDVVLPHTDGVLFCIKSLDPAK